MFANSPTAPIAPTPKKEEPTEKKDETEKGTGFTNYCRAGMMSTCGVSGKKWTDHKACKFGEKSRFAERCMYYIFEEYCDCLEAQKSRDSLKGKRFDLTS